MKLHILDAKKQKTGDAQLPSQFSEEFRPDLIKRAVHAEQSARRQKYGADPKAGMRHSSKLSKRRRKYRGSYGFGISRVNRKIHSRRGTRMMWVGTFSPQTRGGRRAHAPKAEKNWERQINKKEKAKAMRSAMAATVQKDLVAQRGHQVPDNYPFAINGLENLGKTKDVVEALKHLGFEKELERSVIKKVRAGLGKLRGRRYRRKKGLLVVVAGDCALQKAARNIPGLDIVGVKELSAELLAPGAHAGRATLWTTQALDLVGKENLFA